MFDLQSHKMRSIFFYAILLPLLTFGKVVSAISDDFYLNQIQNECHTTNNYYDCAKYSVLRFVEHFQPPEYNLTGDGTLKIVRIPDGFVENATKTRMAMENGRTYTEFGKMYDYLRRRLDRFLGTQGISFDVPEDARISTDSIIENAESRGKKKKVAILFPFLILLKLFKIKILVGLTLLGVMFVKKTMLVAAFVLPSVIAGLKAHCKATQYQVVPYHVDDDHYHAEDDAGYGLGHLGADLKHQYWDKNAKKQPYGAYGRALG